MLKNLHLVGENEEDDLYSEYKELDTEVRILFKAFLIVLFVSFESANFFILSSLSDSFRN